tara:strand:+ start:644 stop:1720 length:1077 start_codon:yes stop_codon:yes gene_type:complete
MSVIDKLYTEWAWRTKSGTPDITNPEDKAVLDYLIKELTEQEDDNIEDLQKNLISIINNTTDPSVLKRVMKYTKNVGYGDSMKSYLESKNLSRKDILYFQSLLSDMGKTGEFAKLSSNPPIFNSKGGNYYSQIPGFTPDELKSLYSDMKDSIQGTVSMGPGEAFLSVFFKNISKAKAKGDLNIGGKEVELKSRTGNTGALVAPTGVARGDWTKGVKPKVDKFVDGLKLDDEQKEALKNYSKSAWPYKIADVVKQASSMGVDETTIISGIDKVLDSSYAPLNFDTASYINNGEFNAKQFILDLAKKLGRAYYKEHGFDAFMISDPNGNFKFYEKDSFVDAIGDEITVANPSDLVPRLKI